GRAEHQRFAFSDRFGTDPVPFLGQSAASLLDLFTVMDPTTGESAGRININTAPRAVLAALAGGISLNNDQAKVKSPENAIMIDAFTEGVCKFRMLYPFMSPSQLTFISTDYGMKSATSPDPNYWTKTFERTAVFSTNAPPLGAKIGALAGGLETAIISDAAVEEWFSKIFHLSQVGSMNLRCYVISQLTDTNGMPRGAPIRRYYQIYTTPYSDGAKSTYSATVTQEGSY
ncbi:MAG: hypothetical protein EBS49_02790, partial [Verrucomicrobia bacterium]|nr:hypothetical protein [Verrucomicrobiota bacterium]